MTYIFYKSYSSQNISENSLDEKLSLLIDSIDNNSENLKILKDKVISTDESINKLKKSYKNDENKTDENRINLLISENNTLKQKINNLKNELSIISKSINNNNNNNNNLKNEFSDLLNLISLKYENGSNVTKQIILLQQLDKNHNNESIYEKLLILSQKNFVGLENLNKYFNKSMKKYLNEKLLKENKNVIIRFLSNYIDIEPNKVLDYENTTLKIIYEAKNNIEKKEIKLSLEKIITLSDAKPHFKIWIQQAKNYIEFKNSLKKISIKDA
tara:strand:+ start:555 stop:1367 length:813 start_codon:yes stop_codon:yes gene_type:complete